MMAKRSLLATTLLSLLVRTAAFTLPAASPPHAWPASSRSPFGGDWRPSSTSIVPRRRGDGGGGRHRRAAVFRLQHLGLVPINDTNDVSAAAIVHDSFRSKLSLEAEDAADGGDTYLLGVVEESDFVEVAKLIVEAFGTEVVRIGSDANAFEKIMMAPAIEFLNGSSSLVAFAEVMAGLRYRLRQRHAVDLAPPDIKTKKNKNAAAPKDYGELVARTSLVFAVSHRGSLIATVELRLQPCDAKIPFSFPSIDKIERNLAALLSGGATPPEEAVNFQPYLSNLCVAKSQRGKGIGRALVSAVETTTSLVWGYERVYLHVDPTNKAAMDLYKSEGYTDVGERWNPFWAGTSSRIAYLAKTVTTKTA
jgi:GNAT superfamily N-acetyltransferase